MSEPKFTKGPWHITEEDWVTGGYDIAVIQDKDGEEVLGISEWIRVNESDLQLIAAAPDMYEALSFVCKECDHECYERCPVRVALRKARGEK